jgi:hypothetical protein
MKILKYTAFALLVLLLFPQCGKAQQATNTLQQPDCIRPVLLTSTSAPSGFDNRQIGCDTWAFAYSATNMSALTVAVESATTSPTGTAGTYTTYVGSTVSGTNPATAITNAEWVGSGYVAWIRVKASVYTPVSGVGEIRGTLYGWKMRGATTNGGGSTSSSLQPGQDPRLTRYQLNKETVLSGTTEILTVQSCATCDAAYFESGDAYCTAAFSVQFSQNGTAATTTAATITGINGASTTNAPRGFSASNVGAGTTLRRYYGAAGQTILFDLTDFSLALNAGTGSNLTMTITSTASSTCRGQMQWRRELQ